MISRLRGAVAERSPGGVEVMTAGGVGYEVLVPTRALAALPGEGEEVELLTHQVVREDSVQLFGFLDGADRLLFGRLLGASGVGPRLALALVSAFPPARLARAVQERDVAALTAVSGVGRKTAERLVLELGGKLEDLPAGSGAPPVPAGPGTEAVRALGVLGFPPAEAERAVAAALADGGEGPTQEIVRAALSRLA